MSAAVAAALFITACGGTETAEAPTSTEETVTTVPTSEHATTVSTSASQAASSGDHEHLTNGEGIDPDLLTAAFLGAAAFQDVGVAEGEGWVSTIDTLGCFENPDEGGMGVHWLNEALLDAELDPAAPEALVYELDTNGEVVGLVGHEYLVPFEAWAAEEPPSLFGIDLHKHPVLPFWILHAYLWKDNPSGMFNDWNPAVRMCPDGVGVFGVDLP